MVNANARLVKKYVGATIFDPSSSEFEHFFSSFLNVWFNLIVLNFYK